MEQIRSAPGVSVTLATNEVSVPGELAFRVNIAGPRRDGEVSGYFLLQRGSDVRRIPFWGRRIVGRLADHRLKPLVRPGVYQGTTKGRPALVSRYRYPESPRGVGVTTVLNGPETVYRVRLTRRVANFGVVITQRAKGSLVEPRIVAELDENRLVGYAGLPFATNPYLAGPFGFQARVPVVAALSPLPGEYEVVFDSATRASAGAFTFRYWVNDVTPPSARLLDRAVTFGERIRVEGGRQRLRRRSQLALRLPRRTPRAPHPPERARPGRDHRPGGQARQAHPAPHGARLPGEQEQRERRAHPPERACADGDGHDPAALTPSAGARSSGHAPRSWGARRGPAGPSG